MSDDPARSPRRSATTRYPVIQPFLDRWSPRSWSDRMPEPDKLRSMFEAARLAPSAHNTQPTRFLMARKGHGDMWERMFACLDDHNREWAHSVPVLILATVARKRFNQLTGQFVPYPHCMYDLGLAAMSLAVQAQATGLCTHMLAAFDPDKARAEFAVPDLFLPGMVIACGYPGAPEVLESDLYVKETTRRTRRALEELVYEDEWGQASALFAAPASAGDTTGKAALRHVALIVRDPEASARFFAEAFGMERVAEARCGCHMSDGTVSVALLLKESADETVGVDHFGLVVDDLEAAVAAAIAAGAHRLDAPVPTPPAHFEAKFVTPDGILFDLSEAGWPVAAEYEGAVR